MPNLLSSIETSDLYDEDITRYYDFKDCGIDSTVYKLSYATGVLNQENVFFYLLEDSKGKHLAIMRLTEKSINGKIYHQINKSYSLVQQKGYGEILYENSLKVHQTDIVSDNLNTLPGSFNLWKKIINKNNIPVYRFDEKNNKRYKLTLPIDDFSVWGIEPSFLEAIKETPWDAVSLEDDLIGPDDEFDELFIDYVTESDFVERTILYEFIVGALRSNAKLKDRKNILLLIAKS